MLDVAAVTFVATVGVLVGSVGWATLGWAWSGPSRRPHWKMAATPIAKAGAALALSSALGLVILSWTPQLHGWQLLPGIALWAMVYVGAPVAKRALRRPD